jgi:hypothetical protein
MEFILTESFHAILPWKGKISGSLGGEHEDESCLGYISLSVSFNRGCPYSYHLGDEQLALWWPQFRDNLIPSTGTTYYEINSVAKSRN